MANNHCIVHSRKKISNFNAAVNQLRRENKFSHNVYQELPKRCCSCKEKKGLKTIDLDILREMCGDIEMSLDSTLKFRFSSNMNRFFTAEEDSDESTSTDEEFVMTTLYGHRTMFIPRNRQYTSTLSDIHKQNKSSNAENKANEFLKTLETFEAIKIIDGCVVHNPKYQSKFNHAINLIRNGKNYGKQILYELPKRCCSCKKEIGLNMIDLNILINICEEMISEQAKKPKSSFDLPLSFESETDFQNRHKRIGRFIGKKGANLTILQDKYNVRIRIMRNFPMGRVIRGNIRRPKKNNPNELQLIVSKKNKLMADKIPIDQIKKEIDELWEEASEIRFIQKEFVFDQNQYQYVSLSFESNLSPEERYDIMSRLIGKKGENLRLLEDRYNIRLHIINNQSSNQKYFEKLIAVEETNPDMFYIFITKKDKSIINEIPIEEAKEQIIQQWKEATIQPVENEFFHIVSLEYKLTGFFGGNRKKLGYFIGKDGQHLLRLEKKYNINIQIINRLSGRKLRRKLAKLQDKDEFKNIYLLITSKNKSTTNPIPIDKIEQDLTQLWIHEKQTTNDKKIKSSMSFTEFHCDNRWYQKNRHHRK